MPNIIRNAAKKNGGKSKIVLVIDEIDTFPIEDELNIVMSDSPIFVIGTLNGISYPYRYPLSLAFENRFQKVLLPDYEANELVEIALYYGIPSVLALELVAEYLAALNYAKKEHKIPMPTFGDFNKFINQYRLRFPTAFSAFINFNEIQQIKLDKAGWIQYHFTDRVAADRFVQQLEQNPEWRNWGIANIKVFSEVTKKGVVIPVVCLTREQFDKLVGENALQEFKQLNCLDRNAQQNDKSLREIKAMIFSYPAFLFQLTPRIWASILQLDEKVGKSSFNLDFFKLIILNLPADSIIKCLKYLSSVHIEKLIQTIQDNSEDPEIHEFMCVWRKKAYAEIQIEDAEESKHGEVLQLHEFYQQIASLRQLLSRGNLDENEKLLLSRMKTVFGAVNHTHKNIFGLFKLKTAPDSTPIAKALSAISKDLEAGTVSVTVAWNEVQRMLVPKVG